MTPRGGLDPRVAEWDRHCAAHTSAMIAGEGAVDSGVFWPVDDDGEVDVTGAEWAEEAFPALEHLAHRLHQNPTNAQREAAFAALDLMRELAGDGDEVTGPEPGTPVPRVIAEALFAFRSDYIVEAIVEGGAR